MMRTRRQRGFTLIELIVVIAIMGVATMIGTVMFSTAFSTW